MIHQWAELAGKGEINLLLSKVFSPVLVPHLNYTETLPFVGKLSFVFSMSQKMENEGNGADGAAEVLLLTKFCSANRQDFPSHNI